jgi:hypothetical protein
MPHGREIYVRIAGNNLQKNEILSPYFWNNSSVNSRWLFLNKMYFPYFNINALPTLIPKKYVRIEPTRFPNVPASTTLTGSNVPLLTRKPENGMIISLGIGMSALSKTLSKKIPGYPKVDMNDVTKSMTGFRISNVTDN